MKTRNFYLCLLLLVLGTANVWADKYYMPKSYKSGGNPRYTDLSKMVGQKFMIYNTAINGGEDRTGFFYNDGVKIVRDKTKERDLYVYNEKYVYTLEAFDDNKDDVVDYYAIKSITSDTYLDINGSTMNTTPVPLYIANWATADSKNWARSNVNYENDQYSIIANGNIGNDVFLVSSSPTIQQNVKHYWNGTVAGFDIYYDGHPFAFYPANEVTSGSYLQDLHIFSRCDIYSAQVIWGYVQLSDNITTSETGDGAPDTSLLIDGDVLTGISTAGNYVQFYLGEAGAQNFYLYLQRSENNLPTSVKIQACDDGSSFTDVVASFDTNLGSNLSLTKEINLGAAYKYIRVVNTTANAAALDLSEAYIIPKDEAEDAIGYFNELQGDNALVYDYASAQQYTSKIDYYNTKYPETKILSGVPLPGNKYRIYADAFTGTAFENKELCYDSAKDTIHIKNQGSYAEADATARKNYEWYCEQTVDGKLVFRNVADNTKYLAQNGKVSDTPYKWTFSTVETHRFGVPLKDGAGEYLTIANSGSSWVPDVATVQNQENTESYSYQIKGADTPDDESDDESITITGGICTDFVFIPVATTSTEKKITFTANEIVKRNTKFTYNGEVYTLPFSRMFAEGDAMPTITLECKDKHVYAVPTDDYSGVWVKSKEEYVLDEEGRAEYADGKITFNLSKLNNGDYLDLRLTIKKPFEVGTDNLYFIRNLRKQASSMQANMHRSNIEIGGEDAPIPTVGSKMYYAKFTSRNEYMNLVESGQTGETITDYSDFDATLLFYFTETDAQDITEYYKVGINSAITTEKCAYPNKWNDTGDAWYVQPNSVGSVQGYAIGLNQLTATNNPGDAWCSNHDNGDKIVEYNVDDEGALWEFIPVDPAEAKPLLKKYITSMVDSITVDIIPGITVKDADKAAKYTIYAKGLDTRAQAEESLETLVAMAQEAHMLAHEVEYALQPLPLYTSRDEIENKNHDHPNWYYLYNVKSKDTGEEYYAKFNTTGTRMKLDACGEEKKLAHMFYFEGKEVKEGVLSDDKQTFTGENNAIAGNALTFDDYLQVDVHNFMVPDTTLVSKNEQVYEGTNVSPTESDGKQVVKEFSEEEWLRNNQAWRITTEFYLENVSRNAYGTCLLAGSEDPLKDNYAGEFQVYLKDDKSLVIKVNNAYDTYRFWHTQDKFSYIKVVITYTINKVQLDVYNAENKKESMTITGVTMNDVKKLTCAWPKEGGVDLFKINVERVKAMNWAVQDTNGGDDTSGESDTWYVLPSSNTAYPGLAIVAGGANDTNFGWTNEEALNETIFSDAGTHDNSTWRFVKIEEFDDHVDELLERYNTDKCVIYNKELAALYRLIKKNASFIKAATAGNPINGHDDEYYFNEIYAAIKAYNGPMPEELKAPKPGKFYTVRPAYEQSSTQLFVNEYNSIVQKDKSYNDAGEYNSRGVWYFTGNEAGDGFYELDGISFTSLHTQSYTDTFASDSALLHDGDATSVTLNPVGGCVVRFQGTDNNYLRCKAVGDTVMVGDKDAMSYGYASTVFNREGTDAASVTPTTFNEFNEILWNNELMQEATVEVELTGADSFMDKDNAALDNSILCPNKNANAGADYTLTFTYTNLPASFTSFNNVGLDIHALNSGGNYQDNNDNKTRQWNIEVKVGTEEDNLTTYGSYTDVDIAADVSTDGKTHKVWSFANGKTVSIENGKLIVELHISKGTTNEGCFFGLSNIILSAEGDTWYIEEMPDENKEKIYHKTITNSVGLSSLMLGYPAKIPDGIKLYYPVTNNNLSDKHITLRSYDGTIAANTPAVMHAAEGKETENFKFYYSTDKPDDDSDKAIADKDGIIIDGSLYYKIIEVSPLDDKRSVYEEEMDVDESKVFMYVTNKTGKKFYWVYENYNADGTYTGSNDEGRHIQTNANRAFLVIAANIAKASSLSLRFDDSIITGIEEIDDDYRKDSTDNAVEGIFDLQGRRLSKITAPGIYIVDGKKVVVE